MKDSLLPLKILVIVMGVVLIGGFVYIFARVAMGLTQSDDPKAQKADCRTITIAAANPSFRIIEAGADGFTMEGSVGPNREARRYDACGQLLQTIKVKY